MKDVTLARFDESIAPARHAPRWLVAYSGGMDSHVLLHMLATVGARPPITALHINHGLHHAAAEWSVHCQQVCLKLGVDFVAEDLALSATANNLEARARELRYEVFAKHLASKEILFLAHHQDDAVETLLLRLLRGAGLRGLAGIPRSRAVAQGSLLRPLLHSPRSTLLAYARQHNLRWVEDPSNEELQFDRNYLRHRVLPSLRQRWPEFAGRWQSSMQVLQDNVDIIEERAAEDAQLADVRVERPGLSIAIPALLELGEARRFNLLRALCQRQDLTSPSRKAMQEVLRTLLPAKEDAQPIVRWQGAEARRFQNRLFLLPELPDCDKELHLLEAGRHTLLVAGQLQVQLVLPVSDRPYTLRFRRGGEVLPAHAGRPRKRLKIWFQEQQLAPWMRGRTPLLYLGDELIAIGDLWAATAVDAAEQVQLETVWLGELAGSSGGHRAVTSKR